jgi:hypothetical protein
LRIVGAYVFYPSTDSNFKVEFGVSLGVLSGSSEEWVAFTRAFDNAIE